AGWHASPRTVKPGLPRYDSPAADVVTPDAAPLSSGVAFAGVRATMGAHLRLATHLRWMRQRRSAPHQSASRIAALRMAHEFFDERLQVGRKKPLRVPCEHSPSADRSFAVDNRNGAHGLVRELYRRGQDANPVAGSGQSNHGIVRAALKQHV